MPAVDGDLATPRVSIVMRTRNRGMLLARAIDDVLAQTFDDWELVLVNDGDGGTVRELVSESAGDSDGRIRIIDTAGTAGMESASNLGIASSRSEFIAVHDDDDTWEPEFLESLVRHLDGHPRQMGAVARTTIVWERIIDNEVVETGREPFGDAMTDVLLSDSMLYNRFVPIALVYRREVHERIGMYRDDLPVVGDWEFNLRLLARYEIGIVPGRALARWHQRREGLYGNSVTAAEQAHRRYDGLVRNEGLASWVREHGPGLPLYLSGLVDGRLVQVEQGLTARIADLEARLLEAMREPSALRSEDRLTPQLRGLLRALPGWLVGGRRRRG